MQDVRELLPAVGRGAALPLRCPHAAPAQDGGVPSVLCQALERANRDEAVSAEVPALVSGRRSGTTIAFFCAGQGIPGVELDDEKLQAIGRSGGLTPAEAHQAFCYTACPVFRDEHDRLERAKTEGVGARFEASGVTRVSHPDEGA